MNVKIIDSTKALWLAPHYDIEKWIANSGYFQYIALLLIKLLREMHQ